MGAGNISKTEFETLLNDDSKEISSDIIWLEDEDHSPSVEFRAEISSEPAYPIFLKGSYNPIIESLSYVIIHRNVGRIYGLDLGKDHHNPSCNYVGEKHKHRWDEILRDKEAYVPQDITEPASNPVGVWKQFCREAKIKHTGIMHPPPDLQLGLFI